MASQAQEEEEWDNFKFPLGLKNSTTTLLGSIRASDSPSGTHP
jgi:hypothetical protein